VENPESFKIYNTHFYLSNIFDQGQIQWSAIAIHPGIVKQNIDILIKELHKLYQL
jgi:hypothetical protein